MRDFRVALMFLLRHVLIHFSMRYIFLFPSKSKGIWSWWRFSYGIPLDSKGKRSLRSYSFQFERNPKSISQILCNSRKYTAKHTSLYTQRLFNIQQSIDHFTLRNFLLNQPESDYVYYFPIDFESNGTIFGFKSIGKR